MGKRGAKPQGKVKIKWSPNFAYAVGLITTDYSLKYAKANSLKLLPKLYYDKRVICLSRKRREIEKALQVEGVTLK